MQLKGDVNITKLLTKNEIIPMTFDLMFTEVFNNEDNIELLEEFISYYMDIPLEDVKDNLKLLTRNLKKKNLKSSKKEVDLLLDFKGKKYNIELSNKWNQGIKDRNVVFLSNIHGEQIKRGFNSYNEIEETIQINLNNFDEEEEIKTSYYFTNEKGKILSKKCRIDVINLEKGSKMSYTDDERLNKLIDWCKVFTSTTEEELKKYSKKVLSKKSSIKLVNEVRRLSGDDEMLDVFDLNNKRDLELKCIYDEMYNEKLDKLKSELDKQRLELEENKLELDQKEIELDQKGLELDQKGLELDQKEKELEEKLQAKEKDKSIEIAKNMINKNIELDIISEVTGLKIEEIEKLK